MSNSDKVNHPDHYAVSMPQIRVECFDFAKNMDFCQGNAFKYVWRAGHKDDAVEDLKKAVWYLEHAPYNNAGTQGISQWEYVFDKLYNTAKPCEKCRLNILDTIYNRHYPQAVTLIKEWIKDFETNEVTNND